MSLLPIFVKLDGRSCLLVGAGNVALEKIGSLLRTGARLRVIAPEARPEIQSLAAEGRLDWISRRFEPSDLDGIFLAVTATSAPDVNAAVYRAAVERNVICNSVDDIPNCDFYFGSVVSRGDLQIAISTAGESPALAQRLRREIDAQFPEDLGPWLSQIGQLRREILAIYPAGDDRRLLLHQLAQRQVCESGTCPTRVMANSALDDCTFPTWKRGASAPRIAPQNTGPLGPEGADPGSVYLVGAGSGDPDLLTIKAARLLATADVVLHDDLVPDAILALASSEAQILNVGKRCGAKSITQEEINTLMVEHARARRRVVRLKSGDPLIFGRANEEIEALRAAALPFEVVPGITAAFAAAAALGRSLTDRHSASSVIFATGHHAQSHNDAPLPAIEDVTRVVYMPGRDLKLFAEEWRQEGLPEDFPCVLVSRAGQPDQQIQPSTLAALGETEPGPAPTLLLAGWAFREPGVSIFDVTPSALSEPLG